MRRLDVLLAFLALTAGLPTLAIAQSSLNLDFESRADDPTLPDGWAIGGPGYDARIDENEKTSGEVSLRIARAQGQSGFAAATSAIPVALARGKTIRYSGAIKTDGVEGGHAGIWLRVDGPGGAILGFDNMSARIENRQTKPDDRGVKGTVDWKRYAIEVKVPPEAININFGCLLSGNGTAWFDALEVEIGGKPYDELNAAAAPELGPKPEQLDWLRANAIPFETDAAGSGFDDLQPLNSMIGDARIVALGEATHGTAEFFRMKHRLTEFLASEMGFTVFAIEASMPEAFRLNDYVLRGEGDPKELLRGMYFWTWNTQEVLDMILWMRRFNASGKGRIEFLGFDMQEPKVAAGIVRNFVAKADAEFAGELDQAYSGLDAFQRLRIEEGGEDKDELGKLIDAARGVLEHLEQQRDRLIKASGGDPETVDWAIQNARIVVQAVAVRQAEPTYRDRSMADNVDWILAHRPPGTKIVLWAHNGHVAKRPGAMGGFLAERHGDDMVVAGFAFHEGRYTAIARGHGLRANEAKPSEPGSVEWAFHQAGLPRAILDLRRAENGSPSAGWLAEPIEHRSIGALAVSRAFFAQELPALYDLLIFFDRTSASELLPPHRRK
jgi:erythromycin esterase